MEVDFSTQEITLLIFGIVLFVIVLISGFVLLYRISKKRITEQFNQANQKEIEYRNKLIEAQIINKDKERKRIASEIHDEIGSRLAILKMVIDALDENNEISEKRHNTLTSSIEKLIQSTQSISHGLLPPELEHAGIELAIKGLIDNINNSSKDLKIRFTSNSIPESRNLEVEISIYRIVFELLHNTIKHAKAGNIDIALEFKEGSLTLDYSDDGVGFDLNSISNRGLGIKNITSRCLFIGATYNIQTKIQNGFKFTSKVNF